MSTNPAPAEPDPSEPGDKDEPSEPIEPRPLRRGLGDHVIAGVASGLGRYIGVDPVLIRLAFVLLTLAGGAGILLYLVLALVMPQAGPGEEVGTAPEPRARSLSRVVGWILIAAGAVFLVGRFVPEMEQLVWPVALLGLGVAVLVQAGRN